MMEISFKHLKLYQACFTILYSGIHGLLLSRFVGVGNPHVDISCSEHFAQLTLIPLRH